MFLLTFFSPSRYECLSLIFSQQSSFNAHHPKCAAQGSEVTLTSSRKQTSRALPSALTRRKIVGAASFVKERREGWSPHRRRRHRTATSSLFDGGKPESHVRAGGGEHHVAGVELDALQGPGVLSLQHSGLTPILGVPHVDPSVLGSCKTLNGVRGTERSEAASSQGYYPYYRTEGNFQYHAFSGVVAKCWFFFNDPCTLQHLR